jgi:predicted transposase/invertase (TIGR01784 family)
MQVAHHDGFEKRAQYYAAKAYTSQLNNGMTYEHLKEIIFLAITDFVMFPDKPGYKSDHVILDRASYSHDLKDFSFTFLELPKFHKTIDELSNVVEKWMYFFRHAPHTDLEELEKIARNDIVIRKAYEALSEASWSEEELRTYDKERKSQLDMQAMLSFSRKEGESIGEARGVSKGITQVAKNMLAKGIDIQTVMSFTGLLPEDIEKLNP